MDLNLILLKIIETCFERNFESRCSKARRNGLAFVGAFKNLLLWRTCECGVAAALGGRRCR